MFKDLFRYEAPEDGGGEAAVEDVSDEVLAEFVPDEASEGDATAQEEAAWALSQDDWQQTVNYLQQTAPIIQQVSQMLQNGGLPQQQQAPAQETPQIDPFDPDSVSGYIQAQIQQGLAAAMQEEVGPYREIMDQQARQQGEQLARQELESLQEKVGKFDSDSAFLIAAGAIEGGQDPMTALRNAAQYSHEWETKIRADEREVYRKELQGLRSAPGEVAAGSMAGTEIQPVPTGPRRYHEIVERYQNRQNPPSVVG